MIDQCLSLSLCLLWMSVSTSLCTVCWLCHYVHCRHLQSAHSLSLPHNVPSVVSVSLCPLQSSKECPTPIRFSHSTVCCICVTVSPAVFYRLSTDCQYLTLHSLLFLFHCATAVFYRRSNVCQYHTPYRMMVMCYSVYYCILESVHFLSFNHTVPSVVSV
jgi:hypothetical protein